jgi:glycosyltransferase involved in cell wall biosynthesis
MRIWLITIGEPWPTDGNHPRLLRTGIMAQLYARGGDEVVWFNGTFDHYKKVQRFLHTTSLEIEPRLTLIGLHAPPYDRNISVRRIRHHRELAREFKRMAGSLERPDVIVASMPPLELSLAAVQYGRAHEIPVVVDIRDLWPDIWLEVAPRLLRPLAKLALQPYYRMLRESVDLSDALSGVSDHAVEWGLDRATRHRRKFDGILPLAYQPPEFDANVMIEAEKFWSERGVDGNVSLTLCYFGNISRRYEFDAVFDAVRLLPQHQQQKIRVVLCGVGESEQRLRERTRESSSIIMPGWVNAPQIEILKKRSQIGLLPYPSSDDYIRLMPNKVFDYLTGGLPILTSLRGVVGDFIAQEQCGWVYANNDAADLAQQLVKLSGDAEMIAHAAAQSRRVALRFAAASVYGSFRERLCELVRQRAGLRR